IRDFHVTGVQTCALPISSLVTLHNFAKDPKQVRLRLREGGSERLVNVFVKGDFQPDAQGEFQIPLSGYGYLWLREGGADRVLEQIGRASCRERVWVSWGG